MKVIEATDRVLNILRKGDALVPSGTNGINQRGKKASNPVESGVKVVNKTVNNRYIHRGAFEMNLENRVVTTEEGEVEKTFLKVGMPSSGENMVRFEGYSSSSYSLSYPQTEYELTEENDGFYVFLKCDYEAGTLNMLFQADFLPYTEDYNVYNICVGQVHFIENAWIYQQYLQFSYLNPYEILLPTFF